MKWIIKKHYEATKSNKQFEGAVEDYYIGKGNALIAKDEEPSPMLIQVYGYSSLAGAKKALKAAQEMADWTNSKGHWTASVELIQVQ